MMFITTPWKDVLYFRSDTKEIARQMTLTKSFGYALKGILYIALNSDGKPKMRVDEIAASLSVPKHFLGKILKKVVKHGILNSARGPHGGFSLNDRTLSTSLLNLATITNSLYDLDSCVLRLHKCNPDRPCPLHNKMFSHKQDLYELFANTTIGELVDNEPPPPYRYV